MATDLAQLMRFAAEHDASDIFIKADCPPCVKIHGRIQRLNQPPLTPDDCKEMAELLMTEEQMARFELHHEMDLGFTLPGVCRFRVNIYQQRGTVGIVMRIITFKIRQLEELGLPEVIGDFTRHRQGFVLMTGPTGCGKSTSLAAMLDLINRERQGHIVTIEDPIEYVHPDRRCIVSQREIGQDTASFGDAMRSVLREAPDIILIGEMRDVETFTVCLQAAETGHLVFSTVHTQSAAETMERIINMFPAEARPEICMRLSKTLLGIVSQALIPQADGMGRLAAVEVLVATPTVAQYIEEGRHGQIYNAIKEGALAWRMQTMNMALENYYREGKITAATALEFAGNKTEMRHGLRQIDADKEATLQPKRPSARPGATPVAASPAPASPAAPPGQ